MYNYEKRLQYPVNIKIKSPKIAQIVISQYGGPDGEAGAAMRYMSQKFAMKNPKVAGLIRWKNLGISKWSAPLFPSL